MTHNGWKNYETWAVALWLDNDEGVHDYWLELAGEELKNASDAYEAVSNLASMLSEHLSENLPEVDGLYADLLNASLGEVNHYEIAQAFVDAAKEELEPEESEESEVESAEA